MAVRISATGFVKSILFLLMMLSIIKPGSDLGSRSRLCHHGSGGAGVRGMMDAGGDSSTSRLRSRERLFSGDEVQLGRKGWRKLLFARRRSAAVVVDSMDTGEPATPNEHQRSEASLSHFAAAFSFFSSMAKGSPSPSPATPSPGHN